MVSAPCATLSVVVIVAPPAPKSKIDKPSMASLVFAWTTCVPGTKFIGALLSAIVSLSDRSRPHAASRPPGEVQWNGLRGPQDAKRLLPRCGRDTNRSRDAFVNEASTNA